MSQKGPDKLMWCVGAAFAVLIAAWTTFLVIASKNRVPEVPLMKRSAPATATK